MSSNTDDTNLLAQNNLIYNSFDWKPITFTHVEYPKGKHIVYVAFRFRPANFAEMFGPAAGFSMQLNDAHTYTNIIDFSNFNGSTPFCVDNLSLPLSNIKTNYNKANYDELGIIIIPNEYNSYICWPNVVELKWTIEMYAASIPLTFVN